MREDQAQSIVRNLDRIANALEKLTFTPPPNKPTIEELERILKSEDDDVKVHVMPNGEVRAWPTSA